MINNIPLLIIKTIKSLHCKDFIVLTELYGIDSFVQIDCYRSFALKIKGASESLAPLTVIRLQSFSEHHFHWWEGKNGYNTLPQKGSLF